MKLIIKDARGVMVLEGITLADGYKPCMDTRELSSSEAQQFEVPPIEPALWFKTLVVISATIDCGARQLSWTTGRDCDQVHEDKGGKVGKKVTQSFMVREKAQMHTEEQPEVFNMTEAALQSYRDKKSSLCFFQEMLKILHCFVLPIITFGKEDLTPLKAVLDMIKALIQRQDDLIQMKQQDIDQPNQELQNLRNKFVDKLNEMQNAMLADPPQEMKAMKIPDDFSVQFQNDLKHAKDILTSSLNAAQTGVDVIDEQIDKFYSDNKDQSMEDKVRSSFHLKGPKRASDIKALTQLITLNTGIFKIKKQKAVGRRNEALYDYNRVVIASGIMEEHLTVLKNSSTRRNFSKFSSKKKLRMKILKDKHEKADVKKDMALYSRIYSSISALKEDMVSLITSKVMLVSIREAIQSAVLAITSDEGACYGVEYSKMQGTSPTDVGLLEGSSFNFCKTLEQQISDVLEDHKHQIAHTYYEAFVDFMFRCNVIKTRYDLKVIPNARHTLPRRETAPQKNPKLDQRSASSVEKYSDFASTALRNLNNDISKHFNEICQNLQVLLERPHSDEFKKVWVCYERQFFNDLGVTLGETYRSAYAHKMELIEKHVQNLTPELLDLHKSPVCCLLKECRRVTHTETAPSSLASMLADRNGQLCAKLEAEKNTVVLRRRAFSSPPDGTSVGGKSPPDAALSGKSTSLKRIAAVLTSASEDADMPINVKENDPTQGQVSSKPLGKNVGQIEKQSLQLTRSLPMECTRRSKTLSKYASVLKSMRVNYKQLAEMSVSFDYGLKLDQTCVSKPFVMPPTPRAMANAEEDKTKNQTENGKGEDTPSDQSGSEEFEDTYTTMYDLANGTDSVFREHEETPGSSDRKRESGGSVDSQDYIDMQNYKKETVEQSDKITIKPSSSKPLLHTMQIKQEYLHAFDVVISRLNQMVAEPVPTKKLHKGYEALHELGKVGTSLMKDLKMVTSDDLNDLLVVLLCNLDVAMLQSLYINMEMCQAFLPPFYEIGQFGFMITTLGVIWQFLFKTMEKLDANVKESSC